VASIVELTYSIEAGRCRRGRNSTQFVVVREIGRYLL
jgi:hypothetical protein